MLQMEMIIMLATGVMRSKRFNIRKGLKTLPGAGFAVTCCLKTLR